MAWWVRAETSDLACQAALGSISRWFGSVGGKLGRTGSRGGICVLVGERWDLGLLGFLPWIRVNGGLLLADRRGFMVIEMASF